MDVRWPSAPQSSSGLEPKTKVGGPAKRDLRAKNQAEGTSAGCPRLQLGPELEPKTEVIGLSAVKIGPDLAQGPEVGARERCSYGRLCVWVAQRDAVRLALSRFCLHLFGD